MGSAVRLLVASLLVAGSAGAATPPAGFVDAIVASATGPTAIAYEPGSQSLFVLEKGFQQARVLRRSFPSGTITTALTLDCVDGNGERGLLGIAFDPDYLAGSQSRYVYLYYTRLVPASGACAIAGTAGSRNRVSRFLESGGTLGAEEVLLEGPVLTSATNHNGGTLRFAPDETLFVSIGDNNTDADANPLSRDLNDLRGKLLRIRRDGSAPPDNPFVGQPGVRAEIWAWGLRNPFRFSIDPTSGIPWIADVGENTWEEIDLGEAGADYGYPCREGPSAFRACNPAPANALEPAYSYGHSPTQTPPVSGGSITGGPVYRGGTFPPEYEGRIFFGDFISQWIRRGTIDGSGQIVDVQMFIPDAGGVVDIIQSPTGCLAWVDYFAQAVHETCPDTVDLDGDGYTIADGDCAEGDASTYPGAPDLCDGVNNDCAGGIDDATCATFDPVDGVDGGDLALLGRSFSACSTDPKSEPWGPVDYTHDGCADGADLAVMAAVWGCRGTVPICP